MKLIILSGPVCSGKTTVADILMKRAERYFHLSYDSLKWQFSQYSSGKYPEEILALRLSMLRTLCELKYNVLTESTHATTRQNHIKIAQEHDYEVIEINLEANRKVLLDRCLRRNEAVPPNKVVSIKRFDEVLELYEREKNPNAITFRTDTQGIEEISKAILKLL